MIISVKLEKAFVKTHLPFIVKMVSKLDKQENFLIPIKVIDKTKQNPTACIIVNSERLSAFPLSSGTSIPNLSTCFHCY